MKCTLIFSVALATAMAATANAALVSSTVDISTTVVGGNPTITTGPYEWSNAVGSNPTISMAGQSAGTPNSLVNVPMVSDVAEIMGVTFVAPAGANKLDKVAWAIINGVASGATYTLRLIDMVLANPNTPYGVAGTDLFNGGAGLSFVHGGTPNNQIVIFDLTGSDEVALTPGNTYVFEVVHTAGTGGITFTRTGGGNSIYANGQYYKDRINASSAGSRDAVAAVYLAAVPEPSTLAIAGCAVALAAVRSRRRM
jgi:hypothetical protein